MVSSAWGASVVWPTIIDESCLPLDAAYGFLWAPALVWDSHLLQTVIVCAISLVVDVVIVWYHLTHNPHPKFLLRKSRKFSIRLHVLAGSVEIIASAVAWFAPPCAVWGRLQACASFVHLLTAAYQTPGVFGTQLVMVPSYAFVILVKLCLSILLVLQPCCFRASLRLLAIQSIYAWCRIFNVIFDRVGLFFEYKYTVAIALAGAVCLPCVGPLMVLLGLGFVALYWGIAGWLLPPHKFAAQSLERSTDMFRNDKFKGNSLVGGSCPFVAGNPSTQKKGFLANTSTSVCKEFFDRCDRDNSGRVTIDELKAEAEQSENSSLADVLYLHAQRLAEFPRKGATGTGFTCEEFTRLLGVTFDERVLVTELKKSFTNEEKCRVIFDAIDIDKNGHIDTAELASLLMQFGLQPTDVLLAMRKYDVNQDGELCFDEFYTGLSCVWKYAFQELQKSNRARVNLEQKARTASLFEHMTAIFRTAKELDNDDDDDDDDDKDGQEHNPVASPKSKPESSKDQVEVTAVKME